MPSHWDSPVPFSIEAVVAELSRLNQEMVPGSQGRERQGPFYGQFSRLLVRLNSRVDDKRYGFLFQAPESMHEYSAMADMMTRLMDYSESKPKIKIIDFSEVPADILPVIVGLVARIIYEVQFWTDRENRKPMALVCDEAHTYLPSKDGKTPPSKGPLRISRKLPKRDENMVLRY